MGLAKQRARRKKKTQKEEGMELPQAIWWKTVSKALERSHAQINDHIIQDKGSPHGKWHSKQENLKSLL